MLNETRLTDILKQNEGHIATDESRDAKEKLSYGAEEDEEVLGAEEVKLDD